MPGLDVGRLLAWGGLRGVDLERELGLHSFIPKLNISASGAGHILGVRTRLGVDDPYVDSGVERLPTPDLITCARSKEHSPGAIGVPQFWWRVCDTLLGVYGGYDRTDISGFT